jgi:hypothetical protein
MLFVYGERNTSTADQKLTHNTETIQKGPVRSGERCWDRERQGASSGELVGEVLGGEVGEAVGRVGQCSGRRREGGVLGRLWEGSPGEPTSILKDVRTSPSLYLSSIGCQENFKI